MDDQHETFIKQTIDLAWAAREKGNHPFGALLVVEGEVILTAENSVVTRQDVTHHAELNLVSAASRQFSRDTLAKAILYTSTEPCAMCTGAIFWAGIRTIVYGCAAESLQQFTGGGTFVVPSRTLLSFGTEKTAVIGPVLEEEAIQVHLGFWS